MRTFRNRRAGLSATAGLSCYKEFTNKLLFLKIPESKKYPDVSLSAGGGAQYSIKRANITGTATCHRLDHTDDNSLNDTSTQQVAEDHPHTAYSCHIRKYITHYGMKWQFGSG